MIECKTCKKKISAKATKCPHCGDRTTYCERLRKRAIIFLIAILFFFILFNCFGIYITNKYRIVGKWKHAEKIDENFLKSGMNVNRKGTEEIVYTFYSNGKCKIKDTIESTESSNFHYKKNDRTTETIENNFEPFNYDNVEKCKYSINKNKIKIYSYFYKESEYHYIRIKKDYMLIDGKKYIKMN